MNTYSENSESISGMVIKKEEKQQQVNRDEEVWIKKNTHTHTLHEMYTVLSWCLHAYDQLQTEQKSDLIFFSSNFFFFCVCRGFLVWLFFYLNSIISCLFLSIFADAMSNDPWTNFYFFFSLVVSFITKLYHTILIAGVMESCKNAFNKKKANKAKRHGDAVSAQIHSEPGTQQ